MNDASWKHKLQALKISTISFYKITTTQIYSVWILIELTVTMLNIASLNFFFFLLIQRTTDWSRNDFWEIYTCRSANENFSSVSHNAHDIFIKYCFVEWRSRNFREPVYTYVCEWMYIWHSLYGYWYSQLIASLHASCLCVICVCVLRTRAKQTGEFLCTIHSGYVIR